MHSCAIGDEHSCSGFQIGFFGGLSGDLQQKANYFTIIYSKSDTIIVYRTLTTWGLSLEVPQN